MENLEIEEEMNEEVYTDFENLVGQVVESCRDHIIENAEIFLNKDGDQMTKVYTGQGFSQTWTVEARAMHLAEQELIDSLETTEISVSLGDGEEHDRVVEYLDVKFTGNMIAINTQLPLEVLEYSLSVAAAKYSIALLQELNVDLTAANCNKAAEYFGFNIFDEGMLEYELENYNEN